MKALVVNCSRNGLGVIRSLGKMGVEIIAVDHDLFAPGLASRYVGRRCIVPSPVKDERGFIDAIMQIGREEAKEEKCCLIPVNDEYVLSLANHWNELSDLYEPIFETDTSVLLDCLEKTRMYRVAERAQVPYPRTRYSPAIDDITFPATSAIASESVGGRSGTLSFPVVVKPFNRKAPECVSAGVSRIVFCQNRDELSRTVNHMQQANVEYVVQEYIPGGDDKLYTAGIFSHEGNVLASFTGRKLRQYPPQLGQCALGELVDEPRLIEYAKALVAEVGFTGIAQIEFKQHGGEFFLMEINPRSWSWNSIGLLAGVNLPWIACNTIARGDPTTGLQHRFSGTWSFAAVDLRFNVFENKNVSLLPRTA